MKKELTLGISAIALLGWVASCETQGSSSNSPPTDGSVDDSGPDDAGGDTDSDSDTDSDADSDTDTDSDADTDTDSDADTDTDADSDSDGGLDGSATDDAGTLCTDNDSDNWCAEFECNDTDSAMNPDAVEILDNGIDDNCDGLTDQLATATENWEMYLAVDNQFDVYFGTPTQTTGARVGQGTDWTQEYFFTAEDRQPTDYLYVATTSDRSGAQGFLGTFTNTTLGRTTITGDDVWEVFPAGAYEATSTYWPGEWPASQLPTQAEVDIAIAHAEANDLWITPVSFAAFDNDQTTDPTDGTGWTWNPWYHDYPGIPDDALWIWYDSGSIPNGRIPGAFEGGDHDEFLVFRVAGSVPDVS